MTKLRHTPKPTGDLQQLKDLIKHSPLEPVFVAIDFERYHFVVSRFREGSDTQVGLSIFDTRKLRDVNSTSVEDTSQFRNYNFFTGSNSYFKRKSLRYLWGRAEKIPTDKMLEKINDCIPRGRNIILVGHSCNNDLAALHALEFDFQTSIVAILDTHYIARSLQMGNLSLLSLLVELECPSSKLHNAGNDANFTLRALILLGVKALEESTADGIEAKELERIETLQSIATTGLYNVDCVLRPKKELKNHMRKKKRFVTKWSSLEKQEEIREERRLKRATFMTLRDSEPLPPPEELFWRAYT